MKKAILLFGIFLITLSTFAQDITGDWYGVLDIGIAQLPLVLHIKQENSGYSATLDSPDQNAKGIPVPSIHFKSDTLRLDLSNLQAKYVGEFDRETSTFDGNFTQLGQTLPLKFSRKKTEAAKRPQMPKKPYPYQSEEITFRNEQQGDTLAGTLTLPKKGKNFPAVILITGSGPQNRNEELLGHKPFLVISDYLTRNGIAVLRYDDRGVGESTGTFTGSTTADFATDAYAAFRYLKTRKEIDPTKIGLMGHSEGGMIAPIVASKHRNVGFLVLLAGPGVGLDKVLLKQGKLIGKASGISAEILKKNDSINKIVFALIREEKDSVKLRKDIKALYQNSLKEQPELNVEADKGMSNEQYIAKVLQQVMDPWMRYGITYNPSSTLEKVKCPVLALNGSRDLQVDADQNLPAIKNALAKGGNTHVTAKKLEGLNHLFQESKTGSPTDYQKIEQTFSPKVLKIIGDWIAEQVQ